MELKKRKERKPSFVCYLLFGRFEEGKGRDVNSDKLFFPLLFVLCPWVLFLFFKVFFYFLSCNRALNAIYGNEKYSLIWLT